MSIHLKGRKRWRLQFSPALNSVFDKFDEFDGGIYRAQKWAPEYNFEVAEGEVVVFPPGYFHETLTLGEQGEKGCATSMTFQLGIKPVRMMRAFLPRLSLSQEALCPTSLPHNGWQ